MELSLAEQLTLVAVDDESGKVATSQLDLGLAGALLVQLALAGRLDVVDGRVTVLDPEPVGEPLLDEALARIGTDKPRKADHWVSTLQKNLRHRVLDELVARDPAARGVDGVRDLPAHPLPRARRRTRGGHPRPARRGRAPRDAAR
jgi:hypothetical protein